jgi:hypothetical protein
VGDEQVQRLREGDHMSALFWIVGVAALSWVLYWYIEVYTPRKHWREAEAEATAILGFRPPNYPPRPPSAEPFDMPLPCDVKVGAVTFRKGVRLGTFVDAARRWHREAFPEGYTLTAEQKAANLARLQACATQEPSPLDAENEWMGDMMVLQVLADSEQVNEQEREVLTRWMEASERPGLVGDPKC